MHYRLTDATPTDEPWLEALRRSVYQDLFVATWGAWDEERHRRHFAACMEAGRIFVIEVDGARVGMVQLFDEESSVEVGEIQIQPGDQSRGLGTRVLVDVMASARKHRKSVRLSVGLKNEGALRLYRRLGFKVVATTDTHYHMECAR